MCIDLAKRFPHLKAVNQNLSDVIAAAGPVPAEVADRVAMRAHNFLEP